MLCLGLFLFCGYLRLLAFIFAVGLQFVVPGSAFLLLLLEFLKIGVWLRFRFVGSSFGKFLSTKASTNFS